MPTNHILLRSMRRVALAGSLLLAIGFENGHAATQVIGRPINGADSTQPTVTILKAVPVTRQGRYTLVELGPDEAQHDLMFQVIEINVPPSIDASVGQALRHVLNRSGYRLCASMETMPLYALPLPAAHLHLGPMTLRDALQTLGGKAWILLIDEESRQVCFAKSSRPVVPAASSVVSGDQPTIHPLDTRALEKQP